MTKKSTTKGSFQRLTLSKTNNPFGIEKISLGHDVDSKQKNKGDSNKTKTEGVISWPMTPHCLRRAINSSSVTSGIIKKICSSADTGFTPTSNDELNKILAKIDLHEAFENLCTYGNVFLEIIKKKGLNQDTNKKDIFRFDSILTETVALSESKNDDGEKSIVLKQKAEQSGSYKTVFEEDDFIHIKLSSLTSKWYGDTIFRDCLEDILILYYIQQVYKKLFENGFIEPTILVDEDMVLDKRTKDEIQAFLKDYVKGVENGFEVGIISGKVKKLEIASKVDHNSFMKLIERLIENIAIAMCVPIEILTGKGANRATRESSFEDFNLTVIKPLQKRFVRQLKESFRDRFSDDEIEQIQLVAVDTKNQEEISKVADRLVRCGVFSLDEAREFVGLEATGEPQDQVRQVYNAGANADKEIEEVEDFVQKVMKKRQGKA